MTGDAGTRSAKRARATVFEDVLGSLPATARILDAGGGNGVPMLTWANRSATGIGLDITPRKFYRTRRNAPTAPLVQGDMRALPFRENTFDMITANHSITHVPDRQHRTVIAEFARVLRSGGQLILLTNAAEWGDVPLLTEDYTGSIDAIQERLVAAGFSNIEKETIQAEFITDETTEEHFLRANYTE